MSDIPVINAISRRSALRMLVVTAALILAFRLVSLWFNNAELFFDEAQYWVWAKEPAFGYFSKPPLLAWIISAFTSVCGDSEFCVRLPSALFHTATGFVIFAAALRLFSPVVALVAGISWLLLPAVTLSSTLISTDVPLLLCWAVALLALVEIRAGEGRAQAGWYVLLAVAFGLGLNAKYAMIYFVLCLVFYGLFVREGRRMLADARLWAALLAGLAFLVPNLLWQMDNQFTTVAHTGENIGWQGRFPNLAGLGEFAGSQFGVAGPVIFGVYLVALFRLWREGASREQKLLIAFSLPVLLLICGQAVMSRAYANWAATAYPAVVILVADLFVNRMPPFWYRLSNGIHVGVLVVLSVLVAFARPGQLPVADAASPFLRMWGGRDLAQSIRDNGAAQALNAVLSASRKQSATLIYYLRDTALPVYAWREGTAPGDHFELTRALQDQPAEAVSSLRFAYAAGERGVPAEVAQAFESVREIASFPEYPGSSDQRRLFILEGYRGG